MSWEWGGVILIEITTGADKQFFYSAFKNPSPPYVCFEISICFVYYEIWWSSICKFLKYLISLWKCKHCMTNHLSSVEGWHSFICLFVAHLSICLYAYLPTYLSGYLSICLSTYLFAKFYPKETITDTAVFWLGTVRAPSVTKMSHDLCVCLNSSWKVDKNLFFLSCD